MLDNECEYIIEGKKIRRYEVADTIEEDCRKQFKQHGRFVVNKQGENIQNAMEEFINELN
jgi:hypothetical protein